MIQCLRWPSPLRLGRILFLGVFLPALVAIGVAWVSLASPARLVIIGDSTVMTYNDSYYPQCGWGQEISHYFQEGKVVIDNRAIGGRSSRSFIEEGRWATVLATLQTGDFVFIQFGHNDRDTKAERHADTAQYRKFLTQYVTESRSKGAIPVLVSPMNMNAWNGETFREVFNEGANDYYTAMQRVVKAQQVPFIDLEKKSKDLFVGLGRDYITRFLFLGLEPGEYPNFPDGSSDGTHFQEMGALAMARLVAKGIAELKDHPQVGALSEGLASLYPLAVQSNKKNAGVITAAGDYPAGAPLTLKVRPNANETFQGWQNSSGKLLGSQVKVSTTMPAEAMNAWALFQGGSTGLASNAPRGNRRMERSSSSPVQGFRVLAPGNTNPAYRDLRGRALTGKSGNP